MEELPAAIYLTLLTLGTSWRKKKVQGVHDKLVLISSLSSLKS